MAITQPALARAVAYDLARIAPPEARIRRIWIWNQFGTVEPDREYVHVSVVTEPLDDEVEHRLLDAIDQLPEMYPDINLGAATLYPTMADGTCDRDWVHPDAEAIDFDGK